MKWDAGPLLKKIGFTEKFDEDTIPLFLADMDFAIPRPVLKALHKRVDQQIFGYTTQTSSQEYNDAIKNWFSRRFDWEIQDEEIVYCPGTVHALNVAVKAFSKTGDGVIIQRPVYPPFTAAIENNGRKVRNNELINTDGYYTIDFEDLKEKAQETDTTMMILCSPHNPVGRIWTENELREMANICHKNDVILISDEIHGDLIRCNSRFTPIANITNSTKIIICTAINKTFNVAGLHCSNIIIKNNDLRKKFTDALGVQSPSPFAITALIAAYNEGEEWLEQLKEYIDGNFIFLQHFLKKHLPKVKFHLPEGTYIGWLDFSQYKMSPAEVHRRIYINANVVLEDGKMFGKKSANFQRICLPTPQKILQKAMERIAQEFR